MSRLSIKKIKESSELFIGALMVIWLFIAAILADLTEDVINTEAVVRYDNYWNAVFLNLRTALGVKIFSVITLFGNWQILFLISLAIIGFFIYRKQLRSFIGPFIFTVLSGEIVTFIGKILIHRYRPENGVMTLSDFSFPSGHSTVAVTFYGFLAYLAICQTKNRRNRYLIASLAAIIIILIGFSRLYLGVHFMSDILAGYLVGFLGLIAGVSLREWLVARKRRSID